MKTFLAITILLGLFLSFARHEDRFKDCNSSDIEQIDSCLVGLNLDEAIVKLKIDSSQFLAFDEPPLILRGITIRFADTCRARIYVERTSIMDKLDSLGDDWRSKYKYILKKKVIGVSWSKPKKNKKVSIGFRIPYWHNL